MKIRTIDKGYDEYRSAVDPYTCMSRHSWRQIVVTKKLKSARQSGSRWLYDWEEMLSYLQNPPAEIEAAPVSTYGMLRKVGG